MELADNGEIIVPRLVTAHTFASLQDGSLAKEDRELIMK
jgi:hypothetical protein